MNKLDTFLLAYLLVDSPVKDYIVAENQAEN